MTASPAKRLFVSAALVVISLSLVGCGISKEELNTELASLRQEMGADADRKNAALKSEVTAAINAAKNEVNAARDEAVQAVTNMTDQYKEQAAEINRLKYLRDGLENDRQLYRESLTALKGVIETNLTAVEEETRGLETRLESLTFLKQALEDALKRTREIVPD